MHFCDRRRVAEAIEGKRVALVGSGPGVLDNEPGLVDSHDVVVRVNNYKTGAAQGLRTDVFYSFFGSSIRKSAEELKRDGVRLCLCKCPDAKFMDSDWHRRQKKAHGVDFRYIYQARARWWFCETYVPTVQEFVSAFNLLGRHVPSTGFSALLLLLSLRPAGLYLTGFDFFSSGLHNVNERWNPGDPSDPIGHHPKAEAAWLKVNMNNFRITCDGALRRRLEAA